MVLLRSATTAPREEPIRVARTQRERTEMTTRQLIETARRMFARDGYAATSLEAVVDAAGVSTGALYHHFGGKRELFQAVVETEMQQIAELNAKAYTAQSDPRQAAFAAARSFLDATMDPGVQQITLIDAPSVLGFESFRELEERYGLGLTKAALRRISEAGGLPGHDVETLAQMLFAALCEGAGSIARANDQKAARK